MTIHWNGQTNAVIASCILLRKLFKTSDLSPNYVQNVSNIYILYTVYVHKSEPFLSAQNITKINDEIYIFKQYHVSLRMRLFEICLEISVPSCRAKDLHLRQVRHAAGLTREFLRQKRFPKNVPFLNTLQ